jgi:hypothetical protein
LAFRSVVQPLLSGSVASGRGFAPFVQQQLYFPAGREVLVPGRASRDRFFGKGVPISDVFALDIDFSQQVSNLACSPHIVFSFCFPSLQIGLTSKAGTSMRLVFRQLIRNSQASLSIFTTLHYFAARLPHFERILALGNAIKSGVRKKGSPRCRLAQFL